MSMNERRLSMHLTEYKLENLEQILPKYKQFVIVSQFLYNAPETLAIALEMVKKPASHWDNVKLVNEFKLETGAFTYGVEENGNLTKLAAIIDSSD